MKIVKKIWRSYLDFMGSWGHGVLRTWGSEDMRSWGHGIIKSKFDLIDPIVLIDFIVLSDVIVLTDVIVFKETESKINQLKIDSVNNFFLINKQHEKNMKFLS